jgi:VIT1/CCC1 family predicted Fe2+/Mn2+ transporter
LDEREPEDVILPTRSANGCDATAIQVFPSARPCIDVEKDILKSSALVGKLAGLPLYRANAGARYRVLWTALFSCVAGFMPVISAFLSGFIHAPYVFVVGLAALVPGAVCSWLSGQPRESMPG